MSPPKKACIIHDVGNKPYIYVLCLFLLGPVLPTKKTTKVSILSLKFFLQVFLQVQGLNLWKKKGLTLKLMAFFMVNPMVLDPSKQGTRTSIVESIWNPCFC